MFIVDLRMPASGPLSYFVFSLSEMGVRSGGTRTEAVQNVPQEKPDRDVASVVPAAEQRA
jgi:hypothetical protein